jgi:hypothetical protein
MMKYWGSFLLCALLISSVLGVTDPEDSILTTDPKKTTLIISNDDYTVYTQSQPGWTFRVRARGDISFSPDGKDIESMAADAYLSIYEKQRFQSRKIVFESGESGQIKRTYYANNRVRDVDQSAEGWIRESVMQVIYETSIGAESRAKNILATGGTESLLQATRKLNSNEQRKIYLQILTDADLMDNVAVEAVLLAPEIISSSSALGDFLVSIGRNFPKSAIFSQALFVAAGEIESSSELRRTVEELVSIVSIDDEAGVAMADAIANITSSTEKATAISTVVPHVQYLSNTMNDLLMATASISSSTEKNRTLRNIAELPGLHQSVYVGIAKVSGTISSDTERSRVLSAITRHAELSNQFTQAYLVSAGGISSSSEKRRAITALLENGNLTELQLVHALAVIGEIVSDSETRQALEIAANHPAMASEAMLAYLRVVERISSPSEQGAGMKALIRRGGLPEPVAREAVEVAQKISSPSVRAEVMSLLVDEL